MPRTRSIAWAQLKLGMVSIAATALAVMIILAVGGQGGFFWQRYPLKAQFLDAQGLKPGAVARLAGKDVGAVKSVEFVGQMIEVTFEVSDDVKALITDRSLASVGSLSLLGESLLDITAGRGGVSIPEWGYVPSDAQGGGISGIATTMSDTLKQAGDVLAGVREGKGTLGKLVTDDAVYRELEQFVAAAGDVAERLKGGQGTVGKLLNDPALFNSLKSSLDNLQTATARLNSRDSALGRFLNDEAMGKSIGTTLSNLEETSAKLNRPDGTVGKLLTERELYDRVNSLAARLDTVASGINTGEGTIGRLLRDQQLYDNMNRAVTELRDLVADIRKDPKKYLRVSVSIF